MEFESIEKEHAIALSVFMLKVANIDGISPEEEDLMSSFSQGLENEIFQLDKNPQWYESLVPPVRGIAFELAYLVGYCDGNLTEEEDNFILKISDILGYGSEQLQAAKKAAQNTLSSQLQLTPEAQELLFNRN